MHARWTDRLDLFGRLLVVTLDGMTDHDNNKWSEVDTLLTYDNNSEMDTLKPCLYTHARMHGRWRESDML